MSSLKLATLEDESKRRQSLQQLTMHCGILKIFKTAIDWKSF